MDWTALEVESGQVGAVVQEGDERDGTALACPAQPELGQVAQVLEQSGVVLQWEAVAVDGVGGGAGEVQSVQLARQTGPAGSPDHLSEPVWLEPVERGVAELLLPVDAEPAELRCGLEQVEWLERAVHHGELGEEGGEARGGSAALLLALQLGQLERAVRQHLVAGTAAAVQPDERAVRVEQGEVAQCGHAGQEGGHVALLEQRVTEHTQVHNLHTLVTFTASCVVTSPAD